MKRDPGENQFLEQIFLLSEQWEAGWGWEPGVNWTCSSILHCPPLVMIINLSWETPSSVLLFVTQPNNKHFLQTLTWNKYIHLSLLLSTQYKHKYFTLKAEHISLIFLWLPLKSEYYRFLEPEKVSSSRNEKMIEKMQQLAKICIRIAKSKAVGGLIRGGWQQEGVVSCF